MKDIRNILIVEENADQRKHLGSLFKEFELHAFYAEDGVDALTALGRMPFDVIILDMNTNLIGIEAIINSLRTNEGPNQKTPILGMTSKQETTKVAGMQKVLHKPLIKLELTESLEQFGKLHIFNEMLAKAIEEGLALDYAHLEKEYDNNAKEMLVGFRKFLMEIDSHMDHIWNAKKGKDPEIRNTFSHFALELKKVGVTDLAHRCEKYVAELNALMPARKTKEVDLILDDLKKRLPLVEQQLDKLKHQTWQH